MLTIGLCLLMLVSEPSQVAVADWPWSSSVSVNDDSTGYRYDPSIAVDPSGNAYAVWEDDRNGVPDIYFAYRPAGTSWGPNVRVNDDAGTEMQGSPSIAVDPRGNAYAVWEDTRNGNWDIYFSYRPTGGSWGSNVKVNDDGGSHELPSIAVDPSGNAYAAWRCWEPGWSVGDICFSCRPIGGSWSTAVKVNDEEGTASYGGPSIAVDPSGNAYAVWADDRNGTTGHWQYFDIYFSYRPKAGTWGPNVRVNDDAVIVPQYSPTIAVDGSRNAYAVWSDRRAGSWVTDLYFAYRPRRGKWSTNIKVNDDGAGMDCLLRPSIAADVNGNAYAVWVDGPHCCNPWDVFECDDSRTIRFAYRPTGGAWGTTLKVNDRPARSGDQPSVAVDTSGNAYAVWDTDEGRHIWFAYWPPRPGDWAPYKMMLPIVFKNHPPP
jgi:hypothetical protein